ncbi:hypothetical protein FV232_01035 [Methylobacterium sp. WL30]|uniref:hypothetical protein n=1 Tax=unclassified Methylobacterium TaxID=2615210 RepID=UPI0011CB741C|nr:MULTISPECIES: hypothetical protein [unclassified Methylobacterium]TXN38962.1 hypothetical protein FV225_11565 [Methylobacterium sp. WL93]TXN52249.1 hypothetical protein FV227_04135 [Methylobacterium sp. WL119]TXN70668.1 hypothetical protein FV232_01035 [Methylobacterium sp. WL30]
MSAFALLVSVPAEPPVRAPVDAVCRLRVRARWRDDGSILTVLFDSHGYRHFETLFLTTASGELALHFLPVCGRA